MLRSYILYCCFRHRFHCCIDCFGYDRSSEYDPLLLLVVSLTRCKFANYDLVYSVTRWNVLCLVQLHVYCRWKRHSSHVKRFKGIISTRRASQKSELNEPVAIANLVTLELDDVNDTEVDNQVPPGPGTVGNIISCSFIVCHYYNAIFVGIKLHIMH